jgi:hypothetical protein
MTIVTEYPPSDAVQDMAQTVMNAILKDYGGDPHGIDGDVVVNALLICMSHAVMSTGDVEEISRVCAAIHHFADYEIPTIDRALVWRFRAMMREQEKLARAQEEGHA